jgi:hydrogenase maturation protein HypF
VREIKVAGVVQGVGFRPFVYRLAERHGIAGWVRNVSSGLEIHAEGDPDALQAFTLALRAEAPPLSHIESLTVEVLKAGASLDGFSILESRIEPGVYQLISPDIATCPDCLREVFDPTDRRYRYPFTNCTNCGPRFTIITGIPYDRPATTMAGFRMCPDCQAEYDDPRDRRFHAQPNACPVCGPQVTLTDLDGVSLAAGDVALRHVADRLIAGQIVAIKGLGGYQLACDATNADSVALLRSRKRRPHKAFAVMVSSLAVARTLCTLTEAETALLERPSAPIVLCRRNPGPGLVEEVAPGVNTLGIMLPYTPLHHILLRDVGRPLVMTSGNLREEPIAQDNDEAFQRLGRLADCFLTHDRPVHSRYDDGVWFAPAGQPQPTRRARGDAPFPVTLPVVTRPTLAVGPELKATFTLTRDRYAFVSQHIGDMENIETLEHHAATLNLYTELFDIRPEVVACDMHPDYHTTRLADRMGLALVKVQHHHAHLASVLAEHQLDEPVIGVIWDGTGYGLDGHIWGGEFLVGDARGFQRAAHLAYLPLPGGDAATQKPYRIAWAYLAETLGEPAADVVALDEQERAALRSMLAAGTRVARTSSMGRLFDAVAALLGVRREVTYEAQAAMELESLAWDGSDARAYPWALRRETGVQALGHVPPMVTGTTVIEVGPLLRGVLDDVEQGVNRADIAYRFHVTMAELLVSVCSALRDDTGLQQVALSGGVFQNRLLLELVLPRLEASGLRALLHRLVPANDGGVSLGQAYVAQMSADQEIPGPTRA